MEILFLLYSNIPEKLFLVNAMPVVIGTVVLFVLAYRFYFSFVAAKVAVSRDLGPTPSHRLFDGQNYYPMNRWVLFGHHFAAIAGAGMRKVQITKGSEVHLDKPGHT
jgi:hypothetical protein